MAIEKTWERVGPIAFTADGTESGLVTVGYVGCLKVKSKIKISAVGEEDLVLQVKRVISLTQLYVGPEVDNTYPSRPKNNLKSRSDISAYTVAKAATITAAEQPKVLIAPKDITQAVYEFEPTVALRIFNVDKVGDGYTVQNPFPVIPSDGNDTLEINNDGSINVNIVSGGGGTPLVYKEVGAFTDTTETLVATYTSTSDGTQVDNIRGEAKTLGIWQVYKGAVVPGNLEIVYRTSPTQRNALILLETIPIILNDTEVLNITFTAERYRTNLLGASASTFTRIEGSTI